MSGAHGDLPILEAIVAADLDGGIGRDGDLPWHLPADLAFFKETTIGDGHNAVIMGRRTWESIPDAYRPLSARRNIVLSRAPQLELPSGVLHATSFADAVEQAAGCHRAFAVGGAAVYAEAFASAHCHRVHLTRVRGVFECDTFLPALDGWRQIVQGDVMSHKGVEFVFTEWARQA